MEANFSTVEADLQEVAFEGEGVLPLEPATAFPFEAGLFLLQNFQLQHQPDGSWPTKPADIEPLYS
jgi:hypothetical protein